MERAKSLLGVKVIVMALGNAAGDEILQELCSEPREYTMMSGYWLEDLIEENAYLYNEGRLESAIFLADVCKASGEFE